MNTIKKATAVITSLLMTVSFAVTPIFASDVQKGESVFKDVAEKDWFYEDVKYTYDNDIMKGVAEDVFAPGANLSRAMAATMLYRMAGEPKTTPKINYFNDLREGEWYYDAVIWAQKSRIVYGYSDSIFAPNDNVTRADFAVMLMRYASHKNLYLPENEDNKTAFKDSSEIPYYSELPVDILHNAEVIKGKTEETFAPTDKITRAEASAMIHRFEKNSVENKSALLSKYGLEIEKVYLAYLVVSIDAYSNSINTATKDSSNIGPNYVKISLNKLQDSAEIPEVEMSVKITYRSDGTNTTVSMKNDPDISGFIGNIELEAPPLSSIEVYKASVDIKIGDETESLIYYLVPEMVVC